MNRICRRCVVSGRVQGVFFRASTARQAHSLGISGYAVNLPDGRVDVLACGSEQAVETLCEWLRTGPPAARVDHLDIRDVDCPDVDSESFTTG